uniref:Uncharacterized protein n=1 Tax=Arundo donax TaxID=35708 RepID=A0A0A8ZMB8_ARUDO
MLNQLFNGSNWENCLGALFTASRSRSFVFLSFVTILAWLHCCVDQSLLCTHYDSHVYKR